ncbi:MAG: SAM hydrolase/SAM-dependent halogenase family protein [Mycobacteriales bacterium]
MSTGVSYDWVSLTTDYGTYDGFVAACHGVIARTAPSARVIDVTHEVPPGDIHRGAVVLAQTVPYLPRAVHVGVVDPGVGTARRGIAIACADGILVGPDNGLLGWAAEALGGADAVYELADAAYHGRPVSPTFHGRDIFTPVAAHIAVGTPPADLGPQLAADGLVRLPEPPHEATSGLIRCSALTSDRFGNVTTSATAGDVVSAGFAAGDDVVVVTGSTEHRGSHQRSFADAGPGELVSFVDSYDHLALAVNGGNAASLLRVRDADVLELRAGG